jgi:hypothetical protein
VLRSQLQAFSVVRLDEFICSTVQNRRIIVVLSLTPIQPCTEQIGDPIRINDGAPARGTAAAAATASATAAATAAEAEADEHAKHGGVETAGLAETAELAAPLAAGKPAAPSAPATAAEWRSRIPCVSVSRQLALRDRVRMSI